MENNAIWGGFSFLVGFLVIFRTSQAYLRFWEGITSATRMSTEFFDSCSALIAFCKTSKRDLDTVMKFQNLVVRLFSMLHAAALGAFEGSEGGMKSAFSLELVDADALESEYLCL